MTVVAALEFDDGIAACHTARQTQGTHRGFGAGGDQSDLLYRWHDFANHFGHQNFALGRRAKREAMRSRLLHCGDYLRMRMSDDGRTP